MPLQATHLLFWMRVLSSLMCPRAGVKGGRGKGEGHPWPGCQHWHDFFWLLNLLLCPRHIPVCHTGQDIFSWTASISLLLFYSLFLWDQDLPFLRPLPSSSSQIWCRGTGGVNLQWIPWLQSSRRERKSNPLERENQWVLQAYQKTGWDLGHRLGVCVFLLASSRVLQPCWWSRACVITPGSGPWECQEGCPQWLSQVPVGMAERHLHAAFWVTRCVSPQSWQIAGFPAAWNSSAEPPRVIRDSRHSHFSALYIRHPRNDISVTLSRRDGGWIPPSTALLVKKPCTLGKGSWKLQLAPSLGMSWVQTFFFPVAWSREDCSYLKVRKETADKYLCLRPVTVHITQMVK